jgi:hypothetical protein
MIKTLAKIIFNFPGAANRVRCTAHIVNLVTKIILRQFDVKKKAREPTKIPENANDNPDDNPLEVVDNDHDVDDLASLAEGLDREEREMADDEDDDDDMREEVAVDMEEIEEVLKEEVLEVAKKVKPIQRVLFKVR